MSDPGALSAPGSTSELTVRHVVGELTESLKLAGVSEARRAAHDIITGILDVPRSWGIRHADLTLDPEVTVAARNAMRMIVAGAPFAPVCAKSAPARSIVIGESWATVPVALVSAAVTRLWKPSRKCARLSPVSRPRAVDARPMNTAVGLVRRARASPYSAAARAGDST